MNSLEASKIMNMGSQNIVPASVNNSRHQPKNPKKSQFYFLPEEVIVQENNGSIDEGNIDVHIDTEEKLQSNLFLVPQTPGSVFGGSRNIMKHQINNSNLNRYLKQAN